MASDDDSSKPITLTLVEQEAGAQPPASTVSYSNGGCPTPCPLNLKDAIEQIALEGPDGMTVECLLYRLQHHPQSARLLQMLPRDRELTFWELSEDRALPQFPVRASMTESDSLLDATCADEKDQERDPYLPPKPALLTDITAKVRVCPKEFFGQKELHSRITIVASKRQRYSAVIKDTNLTVSHLETLDEKHHFLMEKITRSREAGCLQNILNKLKMPGDDEKKTTGTHVQYLIRPLEEAGLVTKQQYAYRLDGRVRHQVLIILKRFTRDYRTKHKLLAEKILGILKNAPGYRMSMVHVKNNLRQFNDGRRIPDDLFKKIYQNLKSNETIDYCLNDFSTQRRVHTIGERDMFLTDKYVKENLSYREKPPPFFPLTHGVPILHQVFAYAEYRGELGFTQRDLQDEFLVCFGKLEARNLIRKMKKMDYINEVGVKEDGKQKHIIYRLKPGLTLTGFRFEDTPAYEYRKYLMSEGNDTNAADCNESLFDQRMRIIMTYIEREQVVPDYKFKDIVSIIRDEEKLSNYTVDRRTIIKALKKLEEKKMITIHREMISLVMSAADDNEENAEIDADETSSVDATFYVSAKCDPKKLDYFIRQHRIRMEIDNLLRCEPSRRAFGRIQGEFDIPKFQRLKAVHLYFWHLAFSSDKAMMGNSDVLSQKPKIYFPGGEWKEFVPPVFPPAHLSEGWINIGEAYLHVPLSIFRKFAPGAMVHFNDPDKRSFLKRNPNILLRHMPTQLRKDLFYGRQNLHSLYECLEKLAYMGLISFESLPDAKRKVNGHDDPGDKCSPWFMSKDVLNVYLHKKATVLDTRSCLPGYMFVKTNGTFSRINFEFKELADVESYWSELQATVKKIETRGTTPLNKKLYSATTEDEDRMYDIYLDDDTCITRNQIDNSKTAEQLRKEWIVDHIRRPDPAPLDTGTPPGPGNGAAGLSPWLFSHLDRNWVRKEMVKPENDENVKKLPRDENVRETWKRDADGVIYKTTQKRRADGEKKKPQNRTQAKKRPKKISLEANLPKVPKMSSLRVPKDIPSTQGSMCHDNQDIEIILSKQMYTLNDVPMAIKRTNFKANEDEVLFHLKVTSSVLMEGILGVSFPGNSGTQLQKNAQWLDLCIPHTTLRDYLNTECGSLDKTSFACYRRLTKHTRYRAENRHDHMLDQISDDTDFIERYSVEAEELSKKIEAEMARGKLNWTSSTLFQDFFRKIYTYVKEQRYKHTFDLPLNSDEIVNYVIREAFEKPLPREVSARQPQMFDRLYRHYGGAQSISDVQTYLAENIFSNILISSNNLVGAGGGFPKITPDITKELILFAIEKFKPKDISDAIRWLVKAKVCKKLPRTDAKSLAFETVKELVENQMDGLVINEFSKHKLQDQLIRKSDFTQGSEVLKELDSNPFLEIQNKGTMPEFMTLAEGVVNGKISASNNMPDKILMLLLTEKERKDFQKEAERFRERTFEDQEIEMAKKAKDHYKHLLVMRGNYDIVDKSVASNRLADERISRTMNLIPSTISVETGAREMDEGKRLAPIFCAVKYKIPEGGNPSVDKRPMVRKVLAYCNEMNFKPSTAKKVEHICLWILQILISAGVGGMDISEIFENAFDNEKSFEAKEIAESIEFLTVEGYIYKLGIETEKCVHYKHAKEWFFETPTKDSIEARKTDKSAPLISQKGVSYVQAWNDFDGGISSDAFGTIMCNIVDLISSNPGITQEMILTQVIHRLVSPASILDLLGRLEKVGIIEQNRVKKLSSCMPFEEDDGDDESEIIYYEITETAIEKTSRIMEFISCN